MQNLRNLKFLWNTKQKILAQQNVVDFSCSGTVVANSYKNVYALHI